MIKVKTGRDGATTAKRIILERLKEHAVAGDTSYPSYSHQHTGLGDLRRAFQDVLESVGGECWFVADRAAAKERLAGSELMRAPGQVCSYVKDLAPGNFDG
jgi:hypothetical protein